MKSFHLSIMLALLLQPLMAQNESGAIMAQALPSYVVYLEVQQENGDFSSGYGLITGESSDRFYLITTTRTLRGRRGKQAPRNIELRFNGVLAVYAATEIPTGDEQSLTLLAVEKPPGLELSETLTFVWPKPGERVQYLGRDAAFELSDGGRVERIKNDLLYFSPPVFQENSSGVPLLGQQGLLGLTLEGSSGNARALGIPAINSLIARAGGSSRDYFSKLNIEQKPTPEQAVIPPEVPTNTQAGFFQKHWPTIGFGALAAGSYLINRNLYNQGADIYNDYTTSRNNQQYQEAEDFRKKSVPYAILALASTGMTAASGFGLINLSGSQEKNGNINLEPGPLGVSLTFTF